MEQNATAARELAASARAVPLARWSTKPAPNGWSAAEHVAHVTRSYVAAAEQLSGGRPMRPIGTAWQRRIWRLLGLTSVLLARRLPRGASSPGELVPDSTDLADPETMLCALFAAVERFERARAGAARAKRSIRVRHPYFGGISVRQWARLLAVHTRHHARAVRALAEPATSPRG